MISFYDNVLCDFYLFWSIFLTLLMLLFLLKLIQWLFTDTMVAIPNSLKHSWKNITWLDKPCYCSICESLMISGTGLFCDCCGVCADFGCIRKADRKLVCKIVKIDDDNLVHHWVKGNLPSGALCAICNEECSLDVGLSDFQCCWCQRTVHMQCKDLLTNSCDLGVWRRLIIPPWSVRVSGRRNSIRRYQHVQSVSHPGWNDWSPIIIIGNRKSGNGDCDRILSLFRRILNPCQVIDLEDKPPIVALQWVPILNKALHQGHLVSGISQEKLTDDNESIEGFKTNLELSCRIMIAGGDGTIAWILNIIHNMGLKPSPAVGILPLGTGNDLSRVLGWGKGCSAKLDPKDTLQQILYAVPVKLDRWQVYVKPFRHLGIRLPSKSMFMYNYLSIGVDAQVTLDFHRTRESRFYLFSSRLFNKFLYLLFGTHQALAANCQNMQDRIEVFMDGMKVDLPSIESIVILNIPFWGAGVPLWSMGNCEGIPSQSISDSKLEVVAIYSSMHIAQLQVGMSQPHRLGQAKNVEIKIKGTAPIQIDGEPWEQHPAYISITHCDEAIMLRRNE